MTMNETQVMANETFAAVADKFGAREAHRLFSVLGADAELLDSAYEAYQRKAYDARVRELARERLKYER